MIQFASKMRSKNYPKIHPQMRMTLIDPKSKNKKMKCSMMMELNSTTELYITSFHF